MAKTRQTLKKFLIQNQISILVALASLCGCSHGSVPKWDGKLYAGDSKRGGVTRAQSNEFVSASDPNFDTFLAMTYHDFEKFYSTYVLGCKTWKKGTVMMSAKEALERFDIVVLDMQREQMAEDAAKK